MNGHDESATSSSTDHSPSSKPLSTPKGLPSLNGKHQDSTAKAKADSRNSTPRQGTQAQSDSIKALEGTVTDLRVRKSSQPAHLCTLCCLADVSWAALCLLATNEQSAMNGCPKAHAQLARPLMKLASNGKTSCRGI